MDGLFFILSNWCSKLEMLVFPNSNGETIYKVDKSVIACVSSKLPQFSQILKYCLMTLRLLKIVEKKSVEYRVYINTVRSFKNSIVKFVFDNF